MKSTRCGKFDAKSLAALADLSSAEASPEITGHDAAYARRGDARGLVGVRTLETEIIGQNRANGRFEFAARRGLLSHLVTLRRRLAVPLTIRHMVSAMTAPASTATIKYGNHESEPSSTLNCSCTVSYTHLTLPTIYSV